MNILTWNIQATKGCDGNFNLQRIVDLIKAYKNLDVICLQEVSKNIADVNSDNQPDLIASHFPSYESIWAPGFSVPNAEGGRSEFGNLTLVKKPLLKWSQVHSLPSPLIPEMQMPRTMAEVVVAGEQVAVTIFNTHLAFHSSVERVEQMQALTRMRDKIMASAAAAKLPNSWGPYIFTNESDGVILCGDLNIDSNSDEYQENIIDDGWVDCGALQSYDSDGKKKARSPTVGCFDHDQWPQGPHVTDYFLATKNIAQLINTVEVDKMTDASDHQPVLLEITL